MLTTPVWTISMTAWPRGSRLQRLPWIPILAPLQKALQRAPQLLLSPQLRLLWPSQPLSRLLDASA